MLHSVSSLTVPPQTLERRDSAQLVVADDAGQTARVSEIADPAPAADEPPHYVNSVDATRGRPIVERVMIRKHELEAALAAVPEGNTRERGDLELALGTLGQMLTGDLEHVPAVVVHTMNRWLESNKHLGERAAARLTDAVTASIDVPVAAVATPKG